MMFTAISVFFSGLFRKLAGWVILAGFFIAAVFAFWLAARRSGKKEQEAEDALERARDMEELQRRQLEDLKEAQNVQNEVNKLDNGAAADKLRDKWSRD